MDFLDALSKIRTIFHPSRKEQMNQHTRRAGPTLSCRSYRLHALLVATLLSSCSLVPNPKPDPAFQLSPAPFYDSKTGIYFPGSIDSLHRQPVVDLEKRSPGLGFAVSYRDPNAKLDVFVYDLQASVIPTGTDSEVIRRSFQEAIADISRAADRGVYSNFQLHEQGPIELGAQQFLHARFSYSERAVEKDAYLLVAGVNGQILKLRAAIARPSEFDVWRAFGHFANSVEQSRQNGYGGVSPEQLKQIEHALERITLGDGLQEDEAQAIAQMELINQKLHNRFDAETAAVLALGSNNSHTLVRFQAYPTTPPRLEPQFVIMAVARNGEATLVSKDE